MPVWIVFCRLPIAPGASAPPSILIPSLRFTSPMLVIIALRTSAGAFEML
jgi:hypothetical protein